MTFYYFSDTFEKKNGRRLRRLRKINNMNGRDALLF